MLLARDVSFFEVFIVLVSFIFSICACSPKDLDWGELGKIDTLVPLVSEAPHTNIFPPEGE